MLVRWLIVTTWVTTWTLWVASCGPVAYVNEVSRNATTSIDAARSAQADKYAPYWWTRATQYHHKARERAARADFQGANRFGKLASQAAEQARLDAEAAKADPSKRPIDVPPVDPTEPTEPTKATDDIKPTKPATPVDDELPPKRGSDDDLPPPPKRNR